MARNRANTHVETISSQEVGSIDDVLGDALVAGQERAENPMAGSEDKLSDDMPAEIQDAPGDSASDAGNINADEATTDVDTAEEQEVPVEKPRLESLSVLANRHRVPSWQQAALLRYMGWHNDRLVSDEDYMAAMRALKTRRIGGGRR